MPTKSCPHCGAHLKPIIEADGKPLVRSVGGIPIQIYGCRICGFVAQFASPEEIKRVTP